MIPSQWRVPTWPDDAGRTIRVLDQAAINSLPIDADARAMRLMQRISAMVRSRSIRVIAIELGLIVAAAVVGVLLHLAIDDALVGPRAKKWSLAICCGVPVFLAALLMLRLRVRRHAAGVVKLMLAEGICPGCGYNLHGVVNDSGGMTLCPECGASWKRERIERSAPFVEGGPTSAVREAIDRYRWTELGKWSIADDRGERVGLVDPTLRREKRGADGALLERLLAARSGFASSGRIFRIILALWLLAVAVGIVSLIISAGVQKYWVVGIMSLGLMAAALNVWRGNFFYSKARIRRSMLKQRLCPSCAEPLNTRMPDPLDGCVVCHTCRASWRAAPPTEAPA